MAEENSESLLHDQSYLICDKNGNHRHYEDDGLLGIMRKCLCNCLQCSQESESAEDPICKFVLPPHSTQSTDDDFENHTYEKAAKEKAERFDGRTDLRDETTQFSTSSNVENSTMIVTKEPGYGLSDNLHPDQTHSTSIEIENHPHKNVAKEKADILVGRTDIRDKSKPSIDYHFKFC